MSSHGSEFVSKMASAGRTLPSALYALESEKNSRCSSRERVASAERMVEFVRAADCVKSGCSEKSRVPLRSGRVASRPFPLCGTLSMRNPRSTVGSMSSSEQSSQSTTRGGYNGGLTVVHGEGQRRVRRDICGSGLSNVGGEKLNTQSHSRAHTR